MTRGQSAESLVKSELEDAVALHERMLAVLGSQIVELASLISGTFKKGGRLFLIGNGGSAAQAQHVAAEFIGRFKMTRDPLPAMALSTDTSILTSIGNDFDFDQVFVRQVEALVSSGDLLVAISTSGESSNVLAAIRAAREKGATIIGFTGNRHGSLTGLVDVSLEVPSDDTARIQEGHLLVWHIVCGLVEEAMAESEVEAAPRESGSP